MSTKIGVPTPNHKLDVSGGIKMKQTIFLKLFIKFCRWYFDKNNYSFTLTYPKYRDKASPNDILYITTNGKIGL